jgi:hypothetical protein
MKMGEAGETEFSIVQRCATYGFWPEGLIESERFEIDSPQEGAKLTLTICLKHYGNVSDHSQPAKEIETATEFAFGSMSPMGFVAGSEFYIDSSGGRLSLKRRFPFEGETDIFFKLQSSSEELPPVETRNKYIELMPALLLIIRMATQDVVTPTWRLQTVTKIGGKAQQGSVGSLRLVPKERDVVTTEKIKAGLIYFGRLLHPESRPEDITRLSIAGRRIMSAYNETDLVDRFCDLWEACEVFCQKSRHLNGKIDNRISQALGSYTGFKHNTIKALIITDLYNIRKNIVHTATESLKIISDRMPILFDVATILYASRIGAPYAHKGPLADRLGEVAKPNK